MKCLPVFHGNFPVTIPDCIHPIPFRTRWLRLSGPMIVPQGVKVGRCRDRTEAASNNSRPLFSCAGLFQATGFPGGRLRSTGLTPSLRSDCCHLERSRNPASDAGNSVLPHSLAMGCPENLDRRNRAVSTNTFSRRPEVMPGGPTVYSRVPMPQEASLSVHKNNSTGDYRSSTHDGESCRCVSPSASSRATPAMRD